MYLCITMYVELVSIKEALRTYIRDYDKLDGVVSPNPI